MLAQDYPNFEYIVVDPGSTDGSREIIEDYRNEIEQIIYDPDEGPADGLNKGFGVASGDIYYYLNADDYLLQGSLRKAAGIFEERGDCDIILGRGDQIDAHGAIVRRLYPSRTWTPYRYAMGAANAIQQGTFFRATAFRATRGFNVKNRTCWDGELLVDMVRSGARVCSTKDVFGCFRVYPDSISGSGRLESAYLRDQEKIRQSIFASSQVQEELAPAILLRLGDLIAEPERLIQNIRYRLGHVLETLRKRR